MSNRKGTIFGSPTFWFFAVLLVITASLLGVFLLRPEESRATSNSVTSTQVVSPTPSPTLTQEPTATPTLQPTKTPTPKPTEIVGLPSEALAPHREFAGVRMWDYNPVCLESLSHPECFWAPHHPPYPSMAVGEETILFTTMGRFMLFNKQGNKLDEVTLWDFSRRVIEAPGLAAGDARVVYDHFRERYFVVAFYFDNSGDCNPGECYLNGGVVLAASRSKNPSTFSEADWIMHNIHVYDPDWPLAVIPDFTSVGFSEEALLVTYSGNRVQPYQYNEIKRIILFDKESVLSEGNPVELSSFSVPRAEYGGGIPVIQPAIHLDTVEDGSSFFVSHGPYNMCNVTVWRVASPEGEPSLSRQTVRTEPPCGYAADFLPQPGSQRLWVQGGLKDRPIYQNGSLFASYTVGSPTRVRFVQIDLSSWPDISIMQEKLLEESDGLWHAAPAIAVNDQNDVAISFGCVSKEIPASVCFSGRLGSDPLGTFRPTVLARKGQAALAHLVYDGGYGEWVARYTTYNGASVDPVDGSAWLTAEYINEEYSWATWVVNLAWEVVP